jgi:hypothetical protein
MATTLTPAQAAALKARIQARYGAHTQAYLSAVAASKAAGGPRGPNPYACPNMGNPAVIYPFTLKQAQRFFSTVIWGYINDAIVAGAAAPSQPMVKFTAMISGDGSLWPNFNTDPVPLPINDQFYGTTSMGQATGTPARLTPTTLQGLGAAPALVTIPNSGGKRGYPVKGGYVIPGNTNGNPVDVVNWLWWGYVNGKLTASKAWGSSPQLKTWGAPFKGYSSVLDKWAPPIIEAIVILGTGYGLVSGFSAAFAAEGAGAGAGTGAGAGAGADAGAGATGGSVGLEPTTVATAAPSGSLAAPISTSVAPIGGTLAPVAAPGAAAAGGAGIVSTVSSGVSAASGVVKAGAGVMAVTGLIKGPAKTGGPVNSSTQQALAAPAASGGLGDLLKKALPLAAVALGIKLLLLG